MITSALITFTLLAMAYALPASLYDPTPGIGSAVNVPETSKARISIEICTGTFPSHGCSTFTMSKGSCINFTGGKGAFYKTLTGIEVPAGYVCTLYKDFSCTDPPTEYVNLRPSSYNLGTVKVPDGLGLLINFDNEASSIGCDSIPA